MKTLTLLGLEWMGMQRAMPGWLFTCHCSMPKVQLLATIRGAGVAVVMMLFLSEGVLIFFSYEGMDA